MLKPFRSFAAAQWHHSRIFQHPAAGSVPLDITQSGFALTDHMLKLMKCNSESRVSLGVMEVVAVFRQFFGSFGSMFRLKKHETFRNFRQLGIKHLGKLQ